METGLTYADDDRDVESTTIAGTLTRHYVESLNYTQLLIDGVPVRLLVKNAEQPRDEHGRWTVSGAAEATKSLYESLSNLKTSHEGIATHIDSLKYLDHAAIKQVATEMGVQSHHLGSKKKALDRMHAMMTARLGHAERGAEIGKVAQE